MPLNISFSKLLALREFNTQGRKPEECLPEKLEFGKIYEFFKSDQRVFDLLHPIPLHQTEGNEKLHSPLALIMITETRTIVENEKVWTRGKYQIKELIKDKQVLVWDNGQYKIMGGKK